MCVCVCVPASVCVCVCLPLCVCVCPGFPSGAARTAVRVQSFVLCAHVVSHPAPLRRVENSAARTELRRNESSCSSLQGPDRTTTPSLQDHHTLLTGPPHPPHRTTTPSSQDHHTLLTGPPHPPYRTSTSFSQDHHTLLTGPPHPTCRTTTPSLQDRHTLL